MTRQERDLIMGKLRPMLALYRDTPPEVWILYAQLAMTNLRESYYADLELFGRGSYRELRDLHLWTCAHERGKQSADVGMRKGTR